MNYFFGSSESEAIRLLHRQHVIKLHDGSLRAIGGDLTQLDVQLDCN
jgi:hypothetical protein